jgi:malic enzyme
LKSRSVAFLKKNSANRLIGLSSTTGAFNKEVLNRLAALNEQPIVFPLSNPATQAECTFAEAMEGTDNRVIFASGTAFPSYTVASTGEVRIPGQGNNMYIFPGLGFGAVLAQPSSISDGMIYIASMALAGSLTPEEIGQGWLYPSLIRIREVSTIVATAVIEQSFKEGLSNNKELQAKSHDELIEYVASSMWTPTQEGYGSSRI